MSILNSIEEGAEKVLKEVESVFTGGEVKKVEEEIVGEAETVAGDVETDAKDVVAEVDPKAEAPSAPTTPAA